MDGRTQFDSVDDAIVSVNILCLDKRLCVDCGAVGLTTYIVAMLLLYIGWSYCAFVISLKCSNIQKFLQCILDIKYLLMCMVLFYCWNVQYYCIICKMYFPGYD